MSFVEFWIGFIVGNIMGAVAVLLGQWAGKRKLSRTRESKRWDRQ